MFQQVSMDAMLVAVAYSSTEGAAQIVLLAFAFLSAVAYVVCTFVGGIVLIKALITFNLMVWVSAPILLIFFVLNGWRYYIYIDPMDLSLLGTWILLLLTSALYWLYDELDILQKLWARGKGGWISQNDVLHVCLILRVIYIATVVANRDVRQPQKWEKFLWGGIVKIDRRDLDFGKIGIWGHWTYEMSQAKTRPFLFPVLKCTSTS